MAPRLLTSALQAMSLAAGLAACAIVAPAGAADVDTQGATTCAVRGYLTDTDPKGTNVRRAPRTGAAVIGHLPPRSRLDGSDELVGAEVGIRGSKNGWLLIEYKSETGELLARGWISGGLVGATIGSQTLRATPSDDGKAVASLLGTVEEAFGPDTFKVLRVHGCQGHFAEVTIVLPPATKPPPAKDKPLRGWVGKMCDSQLTTCDPY
jgi:hypothetical protein